MSESPLLTHDGLQKFAEQHRIPVEELKLLPDSTRTKVFKCAVWIFQMARGKPVTVDDPNPGHYPTVKEWIETRERNYSFKHPSEKVDEVFEEEYEVLKSLLPTVLDWKGDHPLVDVSTRAGLKRYIAVRQMPLLADFSEHDDSLRPFFFRQAAEALHNARLVIEQHPEWGKLSVTAVDPKDEIEAKSALSALLQWLRHPANESGGVMESGTPTNPSQPVGPTENIAPTTPKSDDHSPLGSPVAAFTDGAWLSQTDVAKQFPVLTINAVGKKLERWRKRHDEGWKEVTERRPREAKYLYRWGAVRSLFVAGKTASERRAR